MSNYHRTRNVYLIIEGHNDAQVAYIYETFARIAAGMSMEGYEPRTATYINECDEYDCPVCQEAYSENEDQS